MVVVDVPVDSVVLVAGTDGACAVLLSEHLVAGSNRQPIPMDEESFAAKAWCACFVVAVCSNTAA